MSGLPIRQMLNRNVRAKIEGVPVAFLSLIPKYTYKQITPYRLETLIIYAANLSRDYFNFFLIFLSVVLYYVQYYTYSL